MNKIFRNGLMMLAAGALAVSCADYNDLGGFSAEPDPAYTNEYGGLRAVKTYINREKYPNMSLQTSGYLQQAGLGSCCGSHQL